MSRPVLLITPVLCALIAVGLLSGCGGGQPGADRPAVVPVKGLVLYDGKPVEGAMVVFQPEKHEHGAAGLTDAQLSATLRDAVDAVLATQDGVKVAAEELAELRAAVEKQLDEHQNS